MRGLAACMECGSRRLRGLKSAEGAVGTGLELGQAHCRDCGWTGTPLEFEDEASWHAFAQVRRAALNAAARATRPT